MLTRRDLLTVPAAASLARAASSKLNVLFIAVDDLNTRLGCYGDPVVKSPNIDRLARQGVRFERAYCNYPLCNPSRTSLPSGRRPDSTRVFYNNTPPRTHLGDTVFLPEHFCANGYFTARLGKIAHGKYEDAIKRDVSEEPRTAMRKKQVARGQNEGSVKLAWHEADRSDDEQPDGRAARRIVELMRTSAGKPWFLGCGFQKPHLPWVAPKKYFDLYPPERIQLPKEPRRATTR